MSVSVNEFWSLIAKSGIADAGECRAMAVAYARDHGGSPPADAESLARHLVQSKRLSEFQAKRLLDGDGAELRVGDFVVSEPMSQPPFLGWFWVQPRHASGPSVLAYPIGSTGEASVDRSWLLSHQTVAAEHLQPVDLQPINQQHTSSDGSGPRDLVLSRLPPGQSLAERLQIPPRLDGGTVRRIGRAVGGVLQALHDAGIAHGAVHPERIWMGNGGSIWLLRDATGPPSGPFERRDGWFPPLQSPALYAAPEFSLPGQVPDPLTDQYALGCLLLHLHSGEPPFSGANTDELIRQHTVEVPPSVRSAVGAGAAGDPLLRVVAHAISKNAEARFGSVADMLAALERVDEQTEPAAEAKQAAESKRTSAPPAAASAAPAKPTAETPHKQAPVAEEPAVAVPAEEPRPEKRQPEKPQLAKPRREKPPTEVESEKPRTAARSSERQPREPAVSKPASPESSDGRDSSPGRAPAEEAKQKKPAPAKMAASATAATGGAASPPPASKPRPAKPEPARPASPATDAPVAVPKTSPAVATDMPAAASPAATAAPVGATPPLATAPASAAAKPARRRKKKKKAPLVLAGLGFLVMILMVAVLVSSNRNAPVDDDQPNRPRVAYQPPPRNESSDTPADRSGAATTPDATDASGYKLVEDPNTLWAPPSSIAPPPLRMIPPGPQMVVTLRLRHLLNEPAGTEMLAAIDRELGDAWERLQRRTGVSSEQIERLTLALEGAGDGWPSAALGVELAEPVPLGELQKTWNAQSASTPEGVTVFAGEEPGADAYFVAGETLDDSTPVESFAVGSLDQIKLVAEIEGSAIPLPRQLEQLWRAAPGEADMVVLGAPNFLFADGRQMLDQYASQWADPLKRFLIPDAAGLMVATKLQPQWYVEVQLAPGARTNAPQLARKLEESVQQLPRWAERFLIESTPDSSWKPLAVRLPQMMFAVADHARFGVSADHAVGNLYLPQVAAPNVSLALLLAANTPPSSPQSQAMAAGGDPALTLEQMLERPMSIDFDQESLEVAARSIIDQFASDLPRGSKAPGIFVLGKDLEKEGITQNQQIRNFEMSDEKLRTVLTELVMRANPVTTVESPTEEDQKLVWVVGPNPDAPDEQAILVTTRVAAKERYSLPSEFVAP